MSQSACCDAKLRKLLNMTAISLFVSCLLLIAITSGYWTRRPYSYASCESLERGVPVHPTRTVTKRQLAYDAEFVEDLGIRYADARFGPRSGNFESMDDYGRRLNACISQLFSLVARNDGVTEDQVRASLWIRPVELVIAEILSFVILYCWVANAIAFRIWRSEGQEYGMRNPKIISVYAAILLGFAFYAAGEQWTGMMESIRIGNGHLSDRGERDFWPRHYYLEYVAGVAIFCGAAMLQRTACVEDPSDTVEVKL